MQHDFRYLPLVRNLKIRTAVGFFLLVLSVAAARTILGKGRIEVLVPMVSIAWLVSVFLTD
jgi:hypothetical protein